MRPLKAGGACCAVRWPTCLHDRRGAIGRTHSPALPIPIPGRPSPADGEVIDSRDHTLFWSLSFAVAAPLWRELGGFCEDYMGYGGEDTDFGQVARAADVERPLDRRGDGIPSVPPVSDPPYEHLHDIMRNAAIFHRRWGWWPMTGWLTAFERHGLVRYDEELDVWIVVSD